MSTPSAQPELRSLRIDREKKRSGQPSKWSSRWIVGGILLFLLLGAGRVIYGRLNQSVEVETTRVRAVNAGAADAGPVILNATGYIIAAHKIQLASKVMGKVAWIGVEKGDKVKISGFGNFVVNTKRPRKGRNPQTGDEIIIDGRKVLTFKASQIMKKSLNTMGSSSSVSAPDAPASE